MSLEFEFEETTTRGQQSFLVHARQFQAREAKGEYTGTGEQLELPPEYTDLFDAEKVVHAPLPTPRDVVRTTFGEDAIIRTDGLTSWRCRGVDRPGDHLPGD